MAKIIGLATIVAAMQADPFYCWVPKAEAEKLVADGLAEVNPAISDPSKKGRLATRATAKGVEQNAAAATAPPASTVTQAQFVIEDNVAIPAVTGRGRVGSVYPFEKLNVGQSFFVAKAAKNLASTVSSANARYAELIPGQTRKDRKGNDVPATKFTRHFIVRSVEGGSRIWRKA
jgi:hypothetical protein